MTGRRQRYPNDARTTLIARISRPVVPATTGCGG